MPQTKLPHTFREQYSHSSLANPDFEIPGPIEMLIGSDIYHFILQTRAEVIHSLDLTFTLNT